MQFHATHAHACEEMSPINSMVGHLLQLFQLYVSSIHSCAFQRSWVWARLHNLRRRGFLADTLLWLRRRGCRRTSRRWLLCCTFCSRWSRKGPRGCLRYVCSHVLVEAVPQQKHTTTLHVYTACPCMNAKRGAAVASESEGVTALTGNVSQGIEPDHLTLRKIP